MNSLPNINFLPIHSLKLPVMSKEITFTPFTVEQEKSILIASNSENTDDLIRNYERILKSCIQEDLDWEKMSVIDYVTIILILKSKSKGENLNLKKKSCKKCKKPFEFTVDIPDMINYSNEENKKEILELSDDLKVELRPLGYRFLFGLSDIDNEIDMYSHVASHVISKVIFKNKIYKASPDEIKEKIISNITEKDLIKIFESYGKLINMFLKIEYMCINCGEKEEVVVKDFLKSLK